ncbi:MAG: hypothetical protein IPL22_06290 [Bacteroidetes bacterium]|nr:hypothetical protein [Bacteroidota bacterium]
MYITIENGEKETEGNFEDGLKDGEWIFYFENTSGIRARGTYVNDVKEGKWILYNTDGSINSVETYEKDVLKQ